MAINGLPAVPSTALPAAVRNGSDDDKQAYKAELTYPIPATEQDAGRCCQPLGRTTVTWGAGKEYPVRGEDFSFLLFRKRNCCVGF